VVLLVAVVAGFKTLAQLHHHQDKATTVGTGKAPFSSLVVAVVAQTPLEEMAQMGLLWKTKASAALAVQEKHQVLLARA
jgi:hypothetical protein